MKLPDNVSVDLAPLMMTPFPLGSEGHRRMTHRARFLTQMNEIVPWTTLCALIEPHYRGSKMSPPAMLERMLRIILLRQWFCLSDTTFEDALYDSIVMREFVGIDLSRDSIPDPNAILRFRLVLEHGDLGRQLFAAVSQHVRAAGFKVSIGTLVEATLIAEPNWSERKNFPSDLRRPPPAIALSAVPESHAPPPAAAHPGFSTTLSGALEREPL
jgi:transposase, IS5 family